MTLPVGVIPPRRKSAVPDDSRSVHGYLWLKAALFALLAVNSFVYVSSGTLSEALDTVAWFVLLGLYVLDTARGEWLRRSGLALMLRGLRLVAAGAVFAAAIGYARDREWLDVVNSALWITVVALLEIELRWPGASEHRRTFVGIAAALYLGLGSTILAWSWQAEWFHAYDALLWLAALVVIESNVLASLRGPERPPVPGAA